jgi:alcohol dehydrogenase
MSLKEKDFRFNIPTEIAFGVGSVRNLGEEAARLGEKALVVTDKGIARVSAFNGVLASLKEKNIGAVVFDNVVPNPRDADVHEGVEVFRRNDCNLLIAVGGGSSMDSAKAIGAILTNGGKVADLMEEGAIKNPITPLIAIPTTAGTGSEVTSFSVITDSETHEKLILWDSNLLPKVALLDPEMTVSLPPAVTAGTGLDALTHAIEAYTTAASNPISDGIAFYAIELIGKFIERAYKDGQDIEARSGMLLGSCLAGVAFSATDLGSVHTMGEVLGGVYDSPHGVAMAIFLPYVMEYNLDAVPDEYARVAALLGIDICGLSKEKAAARAVDWVKNIVRDLKFPSLASLGVNPDSFDKMAKLCKEHVCDELNPKPIDEGTYKKLYQMVFDNK